MLHLRQGASGTKARCPALRLSQVQPRAWLQSWQWLQWFCTEETPPASRCKFTRICAAGYRLMQLDSSYNSWSIFNPSIFWASVLIQNITCYIICALLLLHANMFDFLRNTASLNLLHECTKVTPCTVSQQAQVWACGRQSIKWIHPWRNKQTNIKPRYPEAQEQDETLFQQNKHCRDQILSVPLVQKLWTTPWKISPLSHVLLHSILSSESERANDDW